MHDKEIPEIQLLKVETHNRVALLKRQNRCQKPHLPVKWGDFDANFGGAARRQIVVMCIGFQDDREVLKKSRALLL